MCVVCVFTGTVYFGKWNGNCRNQCGLDTLPAEAPSQVPQVPVLHKLSEPKNTYCSMQINNQRCHFQYSSFLILSVKWIKMPYIIACCWNLHSQRNLNTDVYRTCTPNHQNQTSTMEIANHSTDPGKPGYMQIIRFYLVLKRQCWFTWSLAAGCEPIPHSWAKK